MSERKYVGERYIPIYEGTHNSTIAYDPLSVVDNGEGLRYISIKPVPVGVSLDDDEFWLEFATAEPYVLPQASSTVLGGVKKGDGIAMYNDGTILIRPGKGISTDNDTVTVKAGKGIGFDNNGAVQVKASDGIQFSDDGTMLIKPAADGVLGGIKKGGGYSILSDGKLNINAGNGIQVEYSYIKAKIGNGLRFAEDGSIEIDPTVVQVIS